MGKLDLLQFHRICTKPSPNACNNPAKVFMTMNPMKVTSTLWSVKKYVEELVQAFEPLVLLGMLTGYCQIKANISRWFSLLL